MKQIYLASPHMGGEERRYIDEAFETNWIAPLGPQVDAFEKQVAQYAGVKSAVALSSGTAALHLALKAVGIQKGDIVFCPTLTFAASCNPIIYEGGIPVFIDSEPSSWNMSPIALEKALKEYTPKAVIVTNLYGQSADMDALVKLCKEKEIPIIEDAAESLGATYKGRKSGSIGKYGVYSFNGNKIITTSGGGMLISNDEEGIRKARFWATQAKDPARYYQHSEIGYNYRMSSICAAIGRGQMEVLEDRIRRKQEIFAIYEKAFSTIEEIKMMPRCTYGESNCWLSTMTLDPKSKVTPLDIILKLEQEHIESRMIWKPLHMQPIFKQYDFFLHEDDTSHMNGYFANKGEFISQQKKSVAEDIFDRGICLPSDTKMTDEDIEGVIWNIKALF